VASRRRILLIKPSTSSEVSFPLGLASLVPPLQNSGFDIQGCDLDFDSLNMMLSGLVSGSVTAVGITVTSFQMTDVASIVRRIKAAAPDVPVVLGGTHPTLFPVDSIAMTGADLAIRGDGERVVAPALDFLLDGASPPREVAVKRDGWIEVLGEARRETDLDRLDAPDRTFLPLKRYGHAYRSVRYPHAAVVSSRGCDQRCAHCPSPSLRPDGFVARSPASISDEMARLAADYGVRDIHFEDDAFMEDPERVEVLCTELRGGTGPVWELVNGVRPEQVLHELLPGMAEAGCRRIALGLELVEERPGLPEVQPAERIRAITRAASMAGISVTGYFILGYPGRGLEQDEKMVGLSRNLGLDLAHFSPYVDVPGSRFARQGVASETPGEDTMSLVNRAYRGFYLKPGRIARLAGEVLMEPALAPPIAAKVIDDLFGVGTDGTRQAP